MQHFLDLSISFLLLLRLSPCPSTSPSPCLFALPSLIHIHNVIQPFLFLLLLWIVILWNLSNSFNNSNSNNFDINIIKLFIQSSQRIWARNTFWQNESTQKQNVWIKHLLLSHWIDGGHSTTMHLADIHVYGYIDASTRCIE